MTTKRMMVLLEWDADAMGEMWMNFDNLKSLLYTETNTRQEVLKVREVDISGLDQESRKRIHYEDTLRKISARATHALNYPDGKGKE